jgi:hypothetical protein
MGRKGFSVVLTIQNILYCFAYKEFEEWGCFLPFIIPSADRVC